MYDARMSNLGERRKRSYSTSVRNKKVLLSLNEEEYQLLEEAASARGLAKSSLAREVLTSWLVRRGTEDR